MILVAEVLMLVACLGCVGICFKIYSELMKEHTIRRRYESQGGGDKR